MHTAWAFPPSIGCFDRILLRVVRETKYLNSTLNADVVSDKGSKDPCMAEQADSVEVLSILHLESSLGLQSRFKKLSGRLVDLLLYGVK